MNFKESKPIYLQIADRLMDEILCEKFGEEERIPSVREYAALVEVNANTVVRSFDYLQNQEIIYNKRGIGYFVQADARNKIRELKRKAFLHDELPNVFRQIRLLDIAPEEIRRMYQAYVDSHPLG